MDGAKMEKLVLPVIAGPTASGKTAAAVALCELIGGEVVSADSMQVYSGMDILSARPGADEMRSVPHHLMGCVDPSRYYTADAFRADAKACIAEIAARNRVPVLCGGTGLYIDAVTRPMSFSQQSDPALHGRLLAVADKPGGRRVLHRMLEEVDPESAARLHENDVRRVARAVEIYRLTGITQTEHARRDRERQGDYREIIFGLYWPKQALCERIDARVDAMLAAGLVDEVKALMKSENDHPTAVQAIGYKEIAAALRGEMSMDEAVFQMRKATRSLAKRQMTWFRRDPRVIWLDAAGESAGALAARMRERIEAFRTDSGN